MAYVRTIKTSRGPRYKVFWKSPGGRGRSKTFTRSEEARAYRDEIERSKRRGEYVDPARGRVTLAELYRELHAARSYAPATVDLRARLWKKRLPRT